MFFTISNINIELLCNFLSCKFKCDLLFDSKVNIDDSEVSLLAFPFPFPLPSHAHSNAFFHSNSGSVVVSSGMLPRLYIFILLYVFQTVSNVLSRYLLLPSIYILRDSPQPPIIKGHSQRSAIYVKCESQVAKIILYKKTQTVASLIVISI